MGTKARLFAPVSALSLDELVPGDRFYRHLDRVLDLGFVRELVRGCYVAGVGRPSVKPVVFFKLQLVMFFEGIRSERHLLRLAADRLSVRWYLGYNLDEPLPDHSSLTRIRARYGLEVFRRFFDEVVERCRQAGLVWGRELYVDSTKVQANAANDSLTARFAVAAREAVQAHLAALFPEEEAQTSDPSDAAALPEPTPLPVAGSDAPVDALAASNAARHDWIAAAGAQAREVTSRCYRRIADFQVSTTDPDATPMETKGGADVGYRTHLVVDEGKARIILTALVTPSEVPDNQPMLDLLWHTRFRWHLRPRHVTGDRKYGTDECLIAVEAQGIRAYIPSPDMDHRTGFFSVDAFTYDAARDVYVCPAGKDLRFDRPHSTERSRRYRARAKDCNHCPLKAQCTTSRQGRTLCRSVEEDCLERVRAYRTTEAYQKALRKRQVWVEPLFAEAKDWHGLRRFRLRRLWRVNSEALLIAAGQNLKRPLAKRGWGRRPLPSGAALAIPGAESRFIPLILLRMVLHGSVEAHLRAGRTTMATKPISIAA